MAFPFLVTREVTVPTVVVLEAEENSLERHNGHFQEWKKRKQNKKLVVTNAGNRSTSTQAGSTKTCSLQFP